jgi:uncharacterized Ntn-hydrolase superfamily protein
VTLSIVACHQEEGLLGCAVTSCAIAAGRRILHIRAGVGAAVAQASSELRWGEQLLDAVYRGCDPSAAVTELANADNQLAVVNAAGIVGVHTGDACPPHAGHASGPTFSAQANLAAEPDAWERMHAAFVDASGPLAERLVAALAASGGDSRGQQGAAVLVTGARPGDELAGYAAEPHVDLRVDDHRDPVGELARLLALHRAHNEMRLALNGGPDELERVVAPLVDRHPGDPLLTRALQRARRQL